MKASKKRVKARYIETLGKVFNLGPRRGEIPRDAALADVQERDCRRQIEVVPLKSLKKSARNARTHSKKQIAQIANSILRFGFITPIVVDANNRIRAGFGRAEAAESIDLKTVPILRVTDLDDTDLRAFMLADNRIAEGAGWDRELLAVELNDLQTALPEIGLDLSITGFEPAEVDSIIGDFEDRESNPADEIPEATEVATAEPGDLFHLGNHRLIVGDARDSNVYDRLMGFQTAEMAFLDPPYNVPLQGNVAGHGRIKYREFAYGSGELTSPQFTQFLKDALCACARFITDGSIVYVCMDWRHSGELLEAGASAFDELKNICVWTKANGGLGSFYRSAHEFVFVYKKGKTAHINTFGLGQNGRSRTNVWSYSGANSFRAGRRVAIRRWQRSTRKDAILQSTGQTFDELSRRRGVPS
jgi:hypothetical protein